MRTRAVDVERRSSCQQFADWSKVLVADCPRQSDRFDESAALAGGGQCFVSEKSGKILTAANSCPTPSSGEPHISNKLPGGVAGPCTAV